jgi:pimeloyl-ACP methyl ester carboxylesterase
MIRCLFTAFAIRIAILSVVAFAAQEAMAQRRGTQPEKPTVVAMTTKDGVELTGTYYPSTAGKDATPVVLLADWKDSRSVYDQLAKRMQTPREGREETPGDQHQSFAVLTVDLRGHGDSTKQRLPGAGTRELDAAKLDRADLAAMVQFDMNAVRSFLVDENDAGKLNINKLSIVGAGLGASVAVNWAALDWSFPPLAVGKQGQDVKGLVLISPEWSYKGLQLTQALRHPGVRSKIAFLIMYGGGERSNTADAKRIEKQLERYHPRPDSLPEGEPHSLTLLAPETKLQGTQFLTQAGPAAEEAIIKFLSVHVTGKDFDWTQRKRN